MTNLLLEKLNNNKEKTVLIYLKNRFRYRGKVIQCDDIFLEIFDYKTQTTKLLNIIEIAEVNIEEKNE